ncbi:MAG: 4Fe-4S binding protein [Azoarcus sp.]|jgi:polyferredoxin|nr:4Fe-4S binding protein [Azoarcus sp.]
MTETTLHFHPRAVYAPTPGRLERLGLLLRRHRPLIAAVQWGVVLFYGLLVVVPAFLPLPPEGAHLWDNLRLFAQFVFWGLWWPGVMLTTIALGRVWCGLFCPEGFLSELASRHGRGKTAPGWLKWSGWPFVAFVITTVYGQLTSVYEYAEAALLILGGSTLAAIVIGLLYGRDKRVWCHYLCPASGVFAVLAKLAPLHYKVDRAAWDRTSATAEPFNCPPLVDVRRMTSASDCHACARCAGQRKAVQLSGRTPFAEILNPATPARSTDALTLIFGVLGVATMAFQWTVSPWFLQLKMTLATWLVEHNYYALLADNAPWWLLTHYPEVNDVFTWLDGAVALTYILGGGLLLGAALLTGPLLAAFFARKFAHTPTPDWQRFALILTPLGAASVLLGLTMTTATQLRGEHLLLPWIPAARATLLAAGCLAALWLALALTKKCTTALPARIGVFLALCLPVTLMATLWALAFFVW